MSAAAVAVLLLLAQAPATVGDTVWVETAIALPSRMIVRPQPWDLGDLGLVLGPPEVELRVDSASIRYPLALWFPGEHVLRIPGPIVVSPEGKSDTLPTRSVTVRIASVLPPDSSKASLSPEPAADLVEQAAPSLLAVIVLELLVGAAAGVLVVAWRRRARRRREAVATPALAPLATLAGTLNGWREAGELRAAVDGWAHRIESWHPDPADRPEELAAWLRRAEEAGFTHHGAAEELDALLEETTRWGPREGGP